MSAGSPCSNANRLAISDVIADPDMDDATRITCVAAAYRAVAMIGAVASAKTYNAAPGELVLPLLKVIHDTITGRLLPRMERFL